MASETLSASSRSSATSSLVLGEQGLTPRDELPQLLVASDLAGARVVHHHLALPHVLQGACIASVQRGDVLPDRIGLTCGASLPAHQLERTDEVRKPRHPNPCQPRTE
jgi:hypothetical protein